MRPPDTARANIRPELDEAVSSEPVQIKLQSLLQANPFARSCHQQCP
jgi:hypothetical protein